MKKIVREEKLLGEAIPRNTSIVVSHLSFSENELLFRSRDGDVIRLNVETKEKRVIVPNQLFVSTVSLQEL